MATFGILVLLVLILGATAIYFYLAGQRDLILTPSILFVVISVAATIPPLFPGTDSALRSNDGFPVLLAATALLGFVVTYIAVSGTARRQQRWRDDRAAPSSTTCRYLYGGIALLVIVLVSIAIWRFRGLP